MKYIPKAREKMRSNKFQVMRRSRTFELRKSSSMESKYDELRKSPQLIMGEEMIHFGHPQHPLSLVNLPDLFTCAGCKEYGAGKRYVCQRCDYQLHNFCASAPPSLKAHPLHCQHLLLLFSKPVKGQSKCEMCNKGCRGYAFRCSACAFQMHPCCAMLTPEMKLVQLHPHTLRLIGQNEYEYEKEGWCGECKRKRGGRVYSCSVCQYNVHAACAKPALNGLRENGHKDKDKTTGNKMLGSAARLASQVMMEFIGGLIEGLAEGVGQVIAQDAVKAKSSSSSSRRSSA